MTDDGIARFKDFTKTAPAPSFAIDGIEFQCLKGIAMRRIGSLAKASDDLGDGTSDRILSLLDGILEPDSFKLFKQCVETDKPTVIDIDFIKEFIPWLLEQYGLRPTEASSGSSNTLSESGASLTDGAQPEVSISPKPKASARSTSPNIGSRGTRMKRASPK